MTSFVEYMRMSDTERRRVAETGTGEASTPSGGTTPDNRVEIDGAWKLLESFPLAYREGMPRLHKAPCRSVALSTAMLTAVVTAYLRHQPVYTDYDTSDTHALVWRVTDSAESARQFDIQYDHDRNKLIARIDNCSTEQQEFLSLACECFGMECIVKS
jgi:hypothetical protein